MNRVKIEIKQKSDSKIITELFKQNIQDFLLNDLK